MKHPSSIIRTIPLVIVVLSSIVLTSSLDSVGHAPASPRDATGGPVALSGTVTDYDAAGRILFQGSTEALRPRDAPTSPHPLSKDETRVLNLDELAIIPETEPGWILDDVGHEFAQIHEFPTLHDVLQRPIEDGGLVAGDFDGDCFDELLVADEDGVYVYEKNESGYTVMWSKTYPDFEPAIPIKHRSVTAGDFDGDGIEEFALFVEGYTGQCLTHLWVWDVRDDVQLVSRRLCEGNDCGWVDS